MVIVGRTLLNNNYEPAFVAGMLANVMREGSFGEFEGSNYVSNPSDMPVNLKYFVDNHNYTTRFSGEKIYNVDVTIQELQTITMNAPSEVGTPNEKDIFGLGVVQWTDRPRFFPLLDFYSDVSGVNGKITREQVIEAETLFMIFELENGQSVGGWNGFPWGSDLHAIWRSRNTNIESEAAAGDAGYIITWLYIRPKHTAEKAILRQADASNIYNVMMQ